jgi:hypothetical protein
MPPSTDAQRDLRSELEEVYVHYRTARLNVKYYGRLLKRLQLYNLLMELAIAIGTSGTIASLAIWKRDAGELAITIVAAVATLLAVSKPVLNLARKIERASKLWTEYNNAFNSLRRVVADIKVHRDVRPEMRELFDVVIERLDQLSTEDDPSPDPKVVRKLEDEVREEIPESELWTPQQAAA